MIITEKSYQNTNARLDEIQRLATKGLLTKNMRKSLMEIGAVVMLIKQELKQGVYVEKGDAS